MAPLLLLGVTCASLCMPTAPKASNANILREAEDAHAAELASDTAAAFLTDVDSIPNVRFESSEVGARYAGPDAEVLGEAAASVHCTTQPLLTRAECMGLRLEAQAAMAMGLSSDFTYVDVGNIGEVNVRDLPVALPLIRRKMATWLPLLADRFQLSAQSLRVCDAVVIRYDCARRATQQPMHRDAALISFNIPLSADFEYSGGGTCFEGSGEVIRRPLGRLLCHASGMRHAGHQITSGVRWVLVVFLLSTDVPQLPRRCMGIAAQAFADASDFEDDGEMDHATAAKAKGYAALTTALALSPADYQLHHDLGSFHLAEGDTERARRSFHTAATLRNHRCPRPHGALASLMSECGRHRAALRHYEAALDALTSGSQDRLIARAAAIGAAKCVLALHERHRDARASTAEAVRAQMGVAASRLRDALAGLEDIEEEREDEQTLEGEELLRRMDQLSRAQGVELAAVGT